MSRQPDLVIFSDDWSFEEYLRPYVTAAERQQGLHASRQNTFTLEAVESCLKEGNTIWFDQISPLLIELSKTRRTDDAQVVCRLRGTEFLDLNLDDCRWEFFDRLVVSNPVSADVLRDRYDLIDSHCRLVFVPPAVSLPQTNLKSKQQTKKLAYVGRISTAQNGQMLLQCLAAAHQQHVDWKLYVIGEFESVSLRIYFEQQLTAMGLTENIEFNSLDSNLSAWYADKSYFLAPQCSSGQEGAIFNAMAHGLRPIVHRYFGASSLFDEKNLFGSMRDFCSLITATGYRPQDQRLVVEEKYDVAKHLPTFMDVISPEEVGTMSPKVSVLMPTYNRSQLLRKVLTELGNQTYGNREIVVTDDCSTDDTEAVVREMMPARPDIVYHRNETNQGNAANFSIAAEIATGDYLLVCSDDDGLDSTALQRFVRQALKTDADLVYCDLAVTDAAGNVTSNWEYRNYYSTTELLSSLMQAGGNVIPEVFFVKRKLFSKIYTETYARRFINTYYLTMLRELKMSHLPEKLYRYTVHQGSTFANATGLFDRCKSVQNFVNAALFMYSPVAIFGESPGPPSSQVAIAYARAVHTLIEHGKRYFQGQMYTGASYQPGDRLFAPYFFNAYHWLEMARLYGLSDSEYKRLQNTILAAINPRLFDPVKDANMPASYRRLPWFANKPFNNLSKFVALDIATVGKAPHLNQREYTVYREGKAHVWISNHILQSADQLAQLMPTSNVTVINIFDRQQIEPVLRYLAEHQLFSVYVLNFTSLVIPNMDMLRNVINVGRCFCEQFEDYLAVLTRLTTTEHYAHPHLQTVNR